MVGTFVISNVSPDWQKSMTEHINSRRAYYFSAEFLVGQPVYKNLMCLDIESQIEEALSGFERSLKEFEALPDEPLGNGGLGRLAACFLDSAANINVALDGYGIKYRFGLLSRKLKTVSKLKRYIILLNIMTLGVYLANVIRLRSVLATVTSGQCLMICRLYLLKLVNFQLCAFGSAKA